MKNIVKILIMISSKFYLNLTHSVAMVLCLFAVSCAHQWGHRSGAQSGFFVQIRPGQGLEQLARDYKVPEDVLKDLNREKSFRPNEWIFIPTRRGLLNAQDSLGGRRSKSSSWPLSETLSGYFSDDQTQVVYGDGDFLWPTPGHHHVSSPFGMRKSRHHDGIDIPAPIGSPIVSVGDGVVLFSSQKVKGYGKMLIISHGKDVYSLYAHAKKLFVKKGDQVSAGDKVAEIGRTGRSSGPHLHFEIRYGQDAVDPIAYFSSQVQERLASSNAGKIPTQVADDHDHDLSDHN